MEVRTVVFDMDDTLYLERNYVKSGFKEVSNFLQTEFEVEGFEEVAWQLFLDGNRGNIFNLGLEKLLIEPKSSLVDQLVQRYRNHKPNISLEQDSVILLQSIRKDIFTGLITDGPKESQFAKIDSLGLSELIEHIVVTDNFGPEWSKPSDLAFKKIEEITGQAGSNCIYLADNPKKDFIAPCSLGWRTVMVSRPGSLYSAVQGGTQAEFTIPNLSSESLESIALILD